MRLAIEAARVALWSWHVEDDRFEMDKRAFELLGLPWAGTVSFEDLSTLTQRLTALGRAHDVVRPLPGEQGKAALLDDLLSVLFAPYDETAAFSGRIRVAVAPMGVGERTAIALGMVIHELATNSVKHGALSSAAGVLDVSTSISGDEIVLLWAETGGPPIIEAPILSGFGSRLIAPSVSAQLGGDIAYDWQETGLVVTIRMCQARLAE